ncbi:TetR/AcrR family transcriptional regulator [Sporosalibacterium faouarense]|uniref:TetR/AcrR family transcriptional regulator n=1 Tax=Sporosalibacterium faouarense TaxID=516123 RepID=UPI00192CA577|nr:TetR/AcrR family transcriptional regulator [Sporosalibacterium faouarense]
MGLRSKKKELTRKKILEASKELFKENGYEECTTEEIAQRAEIGVGTVYNYYNSKSDIFIAAMKEEFDINNDMQFDEMIDLNKGVSNAVYNIIYKYVKKLDLFSKKIMRELLLASLNSFKSNPNFLHKLVSLDYKIMLKLKDLLNDLKDKRVLDEDFDTKEAIELIYSALFFEYALYIYSEDVAFDECCEGIKRKINFIFGDK